MRTKLLFAAILFAGLCGGVQAQSPYEFVPSEWTTPDGGRVSDANFTYDDVAKTMLINASGTNNTCFMLKAENSDKYYITTDKNYFLVKADNLDTGADCSYIWWFNGYNQGAQTPPNYAFQTSDGFGYVIWRIDNNAAINGYMDYTQDVITISNNGNGYINAIGLTSTGSAGSTFYDINFYSMKEIVATYPLLAAELGYDTDALNALVERAEFLLSNIPIATDLEAAIAQGKAAATVDEICDAVDAITAAIATYESWATLLDFITTCQAEYDKYPGELGSEEFMVAITAAKGALSNVDEAAAKEQMTALQDAYTRFQLYHIPEEGVDMTTKIINASFQDCPANTNVGDVPDGWVIVIDSNGDTVRTAAEASSYFANWVGVNDYSTNAYRENCGTMVFGIWTNAIPAFEFSQTVTGIPDGSYTVKCWMAVGGGGGNRMVDQRLFGNTTEQLYSDVASNNTGDDGPYYQLSVDAFVANGTLTFGVRTGGGTSDGNGWYKVGNFTLVYHGLTAQFALSNLQETVSEYLNNGVSDMVPGIAYTLVDALDLSYDFIGEAIEDEAALQAYKDLLAVFEEVQAADKTTAEIRSLITEAEAMAGLNYPGKAIFVITTNSASNYLANEDATPEGLLQMKDKLIAARITYIFSQAATADAPADVTEVILNPSFREEGQEDNEEAIRTSAGWTANNSSSGDYTTYFNQGHTCWNSWSTSFTSMEIYQQLNGLPAGIYSVSCIALTQSGCLTDQHAFISSDITMAVSPGMTIEGWDDSGSFVSGVGTLGEGIWEELQTEKIKLGDDAALHIGFASTGYENGTAGWFCVTDFKLYYYGTDDSNLFDESVAKVNELKADVQLKGDIAAIDKMIDEAKANVSGDEVYAYGKLMEATNYAKTSTQLYDNFVNNFYIPLNECADAATNESMKAVCAFIINQIDIYLNSTNRVYDDLAYMESIAEAYIDYVEGYQYISDAYLTDISIYEESYVAKFNKLIEEQTTVLKARFLTVEQIEAYTKALEYATKDMLISQVLVATGEVDLSFMVENPSFEFDEVVSTVIDTPPTGWSILINDVPCATPEEIIENGLVTWCGCNMDADATKTGDFIFGIWNASIPNFEISQVIENVPNGHYVVTVDMATPLSGTLSRLGGQRVFLNDQESYFKDYVIDEETGLGEYYEASTDQGPLETITVEADVTNNMLYLGVRTDRTNAHADSLMSTLGVGWFKIDNFTLKGSDFVIPEGWVIDTKVEGVAAKNVMDEKFYNLNGIPVREPAKGINIVKRVYSDGSVKVEKVFIK